MRPNERRETGQTDLFRARLDQIVDPSHALVKLARAIDWRFLEERFGAVYEDGPGRPPHDGVPVAEICRKAGISQATYFSWKKRYEGLLPPEMRRLKQLEDENAKLKKIVADLTLDREMLQDVIRRKL